MTTSAADHPPCRLNEEKRRGEARLLSRDYFASGWAFLVPYLSVYLLYYWRKWPVNPWSGHTLGAGGSIPALLHVYWTLHGLHLLMAAVVFQGFWHEQRFQRGRSWVDLTQCFAPWFLLALFFFIPGAYLEFPSDPVMHYARINEWAGCLQIGDHSVPGKSSYFLTYSLLGGVAPISRQLFWLDVYYAVICLLLCWQYFRLALAVGLDRGAALIFVVLQAVLFGNNTFSFYRYYGIASTIFSQIGVIALVRLGLSAASRSNPTSISQKLRMLAGSGLCLIPLIVFNHVQGVGMAVLEIAAIIIWCLVDWKRAAAWWVLAAVLLLSISAILWWPRNPALEGALRPAGWLNSWYGFNIFSFHSPAQDRLMQILGIFGVVNFVAGLCLLYRNHVVGWLTIVPVLALVLPFVSLPFAGAIASDIIVFQRMLLAIPAGLALITLGVQFTRWIGHTGSKRPDFAPLMGAYPVALLCLLAFMTVPANGQFYNRFWNAVMRSPEDLSLRHVFSDLDQWQLKQLDRGHAPYLLASYGAGLVASAAGVKNTTCIGRFVGPSPAGRTDHLINNDIVTIQDGKTALLLAPRGTAMYTFESFSGYLSTHWSTQEAILDQMAGPEFEAVGEKFDGRKIEGTSGSYYSFGGWSPP
jgi:hypothetical protein